MWLCHLPGEHGQLIVGRLAAIRMRWHDRAIPAPLIELIAYADQESVGVDAAERLRPVVSGLHDPRTAIDIPSACRADQNIPPMLVTHAAFGCPHRCIEIAVRTDPKREGKAGVRRQQPPP